MTQGKGRSPSASEGTTGRLWKGDLIVDPLGWQLHKLTRRSDPEESRLGAADVARRMPAAEARALEVVRAHPGMTCSEMEQSACVLPRSVGKRLNALEKKGKVRRLPSRVCKVTGSKAACWEVVE